MSRSRPPLPLLLLLLLLLLASTGAVPEATSTPGRLVRGWTASDRPAAPSSADQPASVRPSSMKMAAPSADMTAGEADCVVDLGLADGTIPDQNITGWPNVSYPGQPPFSSPAGARLDRPTAWCVNRSAAQEPNAVLTVDLGQNRLISGLKVQGSPSYVHARNHSSFMLVEYSLDGSSWVKCCNMETHGRSQVFLILAPSDSLDTIRTYFFGVLKMARYIRLVFPSSTWPQEVQCVRLELMGCETGWLPSGRVWHTAETGGWLDIMWTEPAARLVVDDRLVSSRLPVDLYSLELQHYEDSEMVSSQARTTDQRWSVSRPLWGASYTVTLRLQISGVMLDWASYQLRARLPCQQGGVRCSLDAVFLLPEAMRSVWSGANGTLITSWTPASRGWRTPQMSFSVVSSTTGTATHQIISSSEVEREIPDLSTDEDLDVYISPVVPELLSTPSFHRRVMLVAGGSPEESRLSRMVEEGSESPVSSVAAVTADVSLRAWPHWSGAITVSWQPAVLRSDVITQPASSYQLTISAEGRRLYRTTVPGRGSDDPLQLQWNGTVAVGTTYQVEVECQFPARNFSCGRTSAQPTAPQAAEATDAGWLLYDLPQPPLPWTEAGAACQRRGGHLASIHSAEQQRQLELMLETLGLSQAWVGLSVCTPYTGRWLDGTRVRFDVLGSVSPVSEAVCCIKLFRTELVGQGVAFEWRLEACDTLLPPLCASHVEGDMMYPVENLTARSDLPMTLDLKWQPRSSGWAPINCMVQVCPTKDLAQPSRPVTLPCTNFTSEDGLKAHISGVASYHEFEITVWSRLAGVQSRQSASVTARTLSLLPISLDISRSGQLTAVWRRKVVERSDRPQVDVVIRKLDLETAPPSLSVQALSRALDIVRQSASMTEAAAASSEPQPDPAAAVTERRLPTDRARRQDALNISWSGLELRASYLMALFDVGDNDTTDFIVFSAEPTCLHGQYQLGAHCFWPSPEVANYRGGQERCQVSGAEDRTASSSLSSPPGMAHISNKEDYRLVKNISLWMERSFWVKQEEKRRRRRAVTGEDYFAESADADFGDDYGAGGDGDAEGRLTPCTYVQRERSGIQSSTSSCDDELHVMCSSNISVAVPAFSERDLVIEPSSSSIRIDWAVPESWAASYLVTVYRRPPPPPPGGAGPPDEPEPDVRIKRRAAASATYDSPPVVLTDLEENAVYEVTLVRRSAGQQSIVGPVAIRALDPPHQSSMFPADDLPRMFLSMSYIAVILTASVVVVVLLLGRVPALECICQISLALALTLGYLIVLLAHGGPLSQGGTNGCRAAAALVHLTFSAALEAGALLALVVPHVLRAARADWLQRHFWTVPLIAAGPQVVVVMVTVAAAKRHYVDGAPQTCWLDLDSASPVLWVVVVHLLLIWLPALFLAGWAVSLGPDQLPPPPHHPDKMRRRRSLLRLRYTLLALLLLLAACWALGVTAAFYRRRPLVIAESVLVALLAAALGLLCADTFVAGARPWRRRVGPDPVRQMATVGAARDDGSLLVKRTFHFGGDGGLLRAVPTPD